MKEQKETIRQWYERTTTKMRRALIWATVFGAIGAVLLWTFASLPFLQRMQTFNGATIIPLAGGIWLFSFVYMFLVPSREAGFRGQESMDEAIKLMRIAVNEQLKPAADTWQRIGQQVEQEIKDGIIRKAHELMDRLQKAAERLEESARKGDEFSKEVKPTIEVLKRVTSRVERSVESGILEDIKIACESVRDLTMPKNPVPHDIDGALKSLREAKERKQLKDAQVPIKQVPQPKLQPSDPKTVERPIVLHREGVSK